MQAKLWAKDGRCQEYGFLICLFFLSSFVPASEGAEARGPGMRDPGPEKVEGKVKNDTLAPPRFLSQGSKKAPGTENRSIHPRRPNKYNNTSDSAPCFSGRESV